MQPTTYLTRHLTSSGLRWAADGVFLDHQFTLAELLSRPAHEIAADIAMRKLGERCDSPPLAPVEELQEVWAAGVTYLNSRLAREAESQTGDVYQRVYAAERPELFFKAVGWRVRGHGQSIRVRPDSAWNVPEPELTLVINRAGEIVGYTAGNDVSSRSIEGENPLYLPQAKIYNGSCALGPGIRLCTAEQMRDLPIALDIAREGKSVFSGRTSSGQMKRDLRDLASHLFRDLAFPGGVFLLTGTGIVPTDGFTLRAGDVVRIDIDGLVLENTVERS